MRISIDFDFDIYIFVNKITKNVQICFRNWYRNVKFKKSINRIQNILNDLNVENKKLSTYFFSQSFYRYLSKKNHVDFNNIMKKFVFNFFSIRFDNFDFWIDQQNENEKNRNDFELLLSRFVFKFSNRYEQ